MIPENERPVMKVIIENIEKYRKERKLSKSQLCEKAEYGYQSYCKLVKGASELRPSSIQKFAYVLKVKTIDLIEDWSE